MTFKELQLLCLARLGDTSGVVRDATPLTPSVTPTTVPIFVLKMELNAAYKDAVNLLAALDCYPVVTNKDVTWAADTQEYNLRDTGESAILDTVPRKVLFVGRYPSGDTTKNPVPARFPWRGDHRAGYRSSRSYVWDDTGAPAGPPFMYLRGYYLGFCVKPTSSHTLQVRYAPVVTELSADDDEAVQIPDEHHEYIAQRAAVMVAGGEQNASGAMISVLSDLRDRLESVAPDINQYSPVVPGAWLTRY